MNLHHFGIQLIWAIGQVSLLLLIGFVLYVVALRRGPAMRSFVAAGTLAVSLAMTLLVLSPWPRWYNVSLAVPGAGEHAEATQTDDTSATGDHTPKSVSNDISNENDDAGAPHAVLPPTRKSAKLDDPARAAMSAFWQSLEENLALPAEGNLAQPRWQWPAVLAVAILAGIAVAVVRLIVGLWAVARYRQSARPVDDAGVLTELAELRSALGCRRAVRLCESSTIGTPATIGWRRPLVLLPADWREWNAVDRRAVLAHELAHVARGDYLSGVVARLATALHFYHPLAHWLARRMRFEQELAADACGVACSGGKESYVVALARMALAQDNRALAWAARPFLPNRSTFLRRIEMLRNTSRVEHAPYRPATRRLVLAALAALAILIAGLRGPIASNSVADAQQPGATAKAAERIDLKGVPEDTVVYAVIRPVAILERDAKLKEMIGVMEKGMNLRENAGISPSDVEELRLMAVDLTVPGEHVQVEPVIVIRTTKPEGWKSLTDQWKDLEAAQHNGQKYLRQQLDGPRGGGLSYLVADDRTIVTSPREEALRVYIDAARGGAAPRWADELKRVEGSDAFVAVDVKFFGKLIDKQMDPSGHGEAAMALAVAPLWRQTNVLVAGAKIDGKLRAEAYAVCKSEQAAQEVAATVNAGRVLLQNMLPLIRRETSGGAEVAELAKLKSDMLDQAEKFLAQLKPTAEGNIVTVKIEGTEAFGPVTAGILLPAIAKAREAAQRAQSVNNLKQIALAMHNYHATYNVFPAAVMLGPDGKTKHSWRVAILPYIEQDSLYKEYNLNEPWDSENNKKLLDKIPAVFRNPNDKGKATSSSYFVLTGKGGIFNEEPAKAGTKMAKISDGTSNTILAVEAQRNIPWTKPEDIPFDLDKDLPKLGGHHQGEIFIAAFADGSVRPISYGVDQKMLKAMITMAGGEVVEIPAPGRLTPQEAFRKGGVVPAPQNRPTATPRRQ